MGRVDAIVVGGGWAGLSAAVELARHGAGVTLLEASAALGGRARTLAWGDVRIDNGQHLLLGAYRAYLDLLRVLGVAEDEVLRRRRLDLTWLDGDGRTARLRLPRLPARIAAAAGLLTMHGVGAGERARALRLGVRLARPSQLAADATLDSLLSEYCREPAGERVWSSLCLAALNTPPRLASARLFGAVIQRAFAGRARDADLLLPTADLAQLLPLPAYRFLAARGARVRRRAPVRALHVRNGRIDGVALARERLSARHVILATGPSACARLAGAEPMLGGLAARVARLAPSPIATVYLQYASEARLDADVVGLDGATAQWLFDRGRLMQQHGLVAAVISGPGEHARLDGKALGARVAAELRDRFPHWGPPRDLRVIRERHATFLATPEAETQRPGNATPVRGLWVAGDYTDTGLPAALEGAVHSGVECARAVLTTQE